MKTFSTSGTGSQQTLSEIESDKIPIYDSLTDVEADLANLEVGQIGATKGIGSELSAPVDTVQSGNMHAVTSNAVSKGLSYSTTEQKTGGTWIDGKPIYRICFVCNTSSSIGADGWLNARNAFTGTETIAQSISSLIDVDIMLNNVYPFIICGALSSNPADIALYNPLSTAVPLTADSTVLIVEYTKTTD